MLDTVLRGAPAAPASNAVALCVWQCSPGAGADNSIRSADPNDHDALRPDRCPD